MKAHPPQRGDPLLPGDAGQSVEHVAVAPPLVGGQPARRQQLDGGARQRVCRYLTCNGVQIRPHERVYDSGRREER